MKEKMGMGYTKAAAKIRAERKGKEIR